MDTTFNEDEKSQSPENTGNKPVETLNESQVKLLSSILENRKNSPNVIEKLKNQIQILNESSSQELVDCLVTAQQVLLEVKDFRIEYQSIIIQKNKTSKSIQIILGRRIIFGLMQRANIVYNETNKLEIMKMFKDNEELHKLNNIKICELYKELDELIQKKKINSNDKPNKSQIITYTNFLQTLMIIMYKLQDKNKLMILQTQMIKNASSSEIENYIKEGRETENTLKNLLNQLNVIIDELPKKIPKFILSQLEKRLPYENRSEKDLCYNIRKALIKFNNLMETHTSRMQTGKTNCKKQKI
jgi:hypothetical protein